MPMGVGHQGQIEWTEGTGTLSGWPCCEGSPGLSAALDPCKAAVERGCCATEAARSTESVWPYVVAGLLVGGIGAGVATHAYLTRKGRRR